MTEQWTFGGVNLESAGVSGVRLLSAVDGAPGRRGGNVVLPGRRGRRVRYAPVDQRIISLALFVQGASRSGLQANVDAVLKVLGKEGRQTLTRTLADGSQRSLLAELVAETPAVYRSDLLAELAVDLVAEPWWQSGSLSSTGSGTISTASHGFAITNSGSAEHRGASIVVAGTITNPKIAIGDVWIQYTGTVGASALTIDCGGWTVSGGSYSAANVSHGGDVAWLMVPPGASTVRVTSSSRSGSPSVTVSFYPRYF